MIRYISVSTLKNMQNLQVQSKEDIKAIISSLDTVSCHTLIRATSKGEFEQEFVFTVKDKVILGHHIENLFKAGFRLDMIIPDKSKQIRFYMTKNLTQQTIIEEVQ